MTPAALISAVCGGRNRSPQLIIFPDVSLYGAHTLWIHPIDIGVESTRQSMAMEPATKITILTKAMDSDCQPLCGETRRAVRRLWRRASMSGRLCAGDSVSAARIGSYGKVSGPLRCKISYSAVAMIV